jgi:metallo-beta-lactamase family protein
MKLKFCGAAREVTGSSHLLILDDGTHILLDCGLYQGGGDDDGRSKDDIPNPMADFNDKWLFDPTRLDCLIVSHSHIDHTGRIPKLVRDGFRGTIYSTHATRDLCALMLMDSAKIQEADTKRHNKKKHFEDEEKEPLYTMEDVTETIRLFASYNYDQWFQVRSNVRVQFRDAGHILGSASITVEVTENGKTTRIGFTGDIGRPNRPILGDPLPMPEVDYLICESTYGDREHETAPDEVERFTNIIKYTCLEKQGKVIIPAFSVGRTQEVVFMLDKLKHLGKLPAIPVYVDSPLAVNATDVFVKHPECFDADVHRYMLEDNNPFGFNDLVYVRDIEASKRLNEMRKPCIIISSSGMMNSGRVKHHLANNIENPRNTFLIVGYCSPNTPGGQLRAGAKSLWLMGEDKQVRAQIEVMDSFSAHGDRLEMFDMIQNQVQTARKVFLTHGTLDRQEKWREFLLNKGFKSVEIPELGSEYDITVSS